MTRGSRLLLVLAPGVFAYSLMQSMTVPALPVIGRELGSDQSTTAWVLTAFLLSAAVSTPIGGRLGDSHGKRNVLLFSFGIIAVGAVLAALADSMPVMLTARVVQGMGAAALPLTFGIIRDEIDPRRASSAMGITSALLAAGLAGGVVLTGPVISVAGHHWIFLLPGLITVVSGVAVYVAVPPSRRRTRETLPVLPVLLLGGWLAPFLLGVSRAADWGWGSAPTGICLATAVVLFAAWVRAELASDRPLIDLRLLAIRGVWSASAVGFCIGLSMYGSFGFLPQFNQTAPEHGYGFGASVAEAGHMMLPAAVASFVCGVFGARAAARLGLRRTIGLGCFCAAGGLLIAALAHEEKWEILIASALSGLGSGITLACLAHVALSAAPLERTGVAAGIQANLRTIGGSIGAAVMTSFLAAARQPSGVPAEWGYSAGFLALTSAALIAAVLVVFIPAQQPDH